MTTWCDAKTAVQVVESGNRVYLHGRCSTPTPLIEALVARGDELQDVELLSTLSFGPVPYTDPRWAGHFRVRAIFVGASEREAINAGRASYAPAFLSTIPKLFMPGGPWPIDVAFIQVSPPDKYGNCSLGPSVDATREAVDYARQVIALVNPQVPWAHGDSFVHVSQLDYAVKWEEPLHEVGQQAPNQMQREMARHVAELIEDGATLQLGIGAIPDAILQALTDRRDLGIHSEMFSDGVLLRSLTTATTDFNGNGQYDVFDLATWAQAQAASPQDLRADYTGDGVVGLLDLAMEMEDPRQLGARRERVDHSFQ